MTGWGSNPFLSVVERAARTTNLRHVRNPAISTAVIAEPRNFRGAERAIVFEQAVKMAEAGDLLDLAQGALIALNRGHEYFTRRDALFQTQLYVLFTMAMGDATAAPRPLKAELKLNAALVRETLDSVHDLVRRIPPELEDAIDLPSEVFAIRALAMAATKRTRSGEVRRDFPYCPHPFAFVLVDADQVGVDLLPLLEHAVEKDVLLVVGTSPCSGGISPLIVNLLESAEHQMRVDRIRGSLMAETNLPEEFLGHGTHILAVAGSSGDAIHTVRDAAQATVKSDASESKKKPPPQFDMVYAISDALSVSHAHREQPRVEVVAPDRVREHPVLSQYLAA